MPDFFDFSKWRSKRIYMCKTPGFNLWVSWLLIGASSSSYGWHKPTRQQIKDGIKSWPWPEEMTDCRCRDCRYYRLTKNKN